jgi:trehalose 6-phosphate synthase/phosphatase
MSAIDRPSDSLTAEQTREVPGELAGALAPLLEGAINPVLVLDYDGTIREFTERPEHATPTDSVLRLLGDLEQLNGCTVVLSSGRDVWTMTEWFGHLNIILMAEHGAWIRMHQTDEWHASPTLGDGDWKRLVLPMLTDYVSRTPGSIVEEKTAALVWHYRAAESDLGTWQARELTSQLEEMLSREQVEVLEGARNVEMRQQGIDKGTAYQEISSILGPFDFCIALGDDRTDEDLFQALPRDAQTISVGDALLSARYRLSGPSEARSFLRTLLADE